MANEQDPDVKDVERVEVAPAAEGEETVEAPDSSQEKEEESKEESPEEPEVEEKEEPTEPEPEPKNAVPETDSDEGKTYEELQRIPGETPKEWALRLTNAKLRDQLKSKQTDEIKIFTPPPTKKELSPEKKAVLEKYKKEDLATLREVFDVLADDMGFVKSDQMEATTFQREGRDILDNFLDKHPEYLPKNDKGGILWKQFQEEFATRRPPQNKRELAMFLEKTHREVYGIKPTAALNKQDAAKEKIKVASHSGSSKPSPSREGVKREKAATGLRTDMLKGFSDEEIADLEGTATE
jgi:hypothetical protein